MAGARRIPCGLLPAVCPRPHTLFYWRHLGVWRDRVALRHLSVHTFATEKVLCILSGTCAAAEGLRHGLAVRRREPQKFAGLLGLRAVGVRGEQNVVGRAEPEVVLPVASSLPSS